MQKLLVNWQSMRSRFPPISTTHVTTPMSRQWWLTCPSNTTACARPAWRTNLRTFVRFTKLPHEGFGWETTKICWGGIFTSTLWDSFGFGWFHIDLGNVYLKSLRIYYDIVGLWFAKICWGILSYQKIMQMIQFDQKIGLEIPPTRNYISGIAFCGILSYRWFKYHIFEGSNNASVGYVLFESFALNSALLICLRLEMFWLVNIWWKSSRFIVARDHGSRYVGPTHVR